MGEQDTELSEFKSSLIPLNITFEKYQKPFRLGVGTFEEFIFAEDNPRFMKKQQFQQLVANIKADGASSSWPLCWIDKDNKIYVLSGHHRIRAGHEAGEKYHFYIYTNRNLSRQQQIAIRISHNSIVGEDDPGQLKKIWEEIEDIALKQYAGIDDTYFEAFKPIDLKAFSDQALVMQSIDLLFLPKELESLKSCLKEITNGSKLHLIGAKEQFPEIAKAIIEAKDSMRIINTSTAFMAMVYVTHLYCEFLETHNRMPDSKEDWLQIHTQLDQLGFVNQLEPKKAKA